MADIDDTGALPAIYELSADEANELLLRFLKTGRDTFDELEVDAVTFDYSKESAIALIRHVAAHEVREGPAHEESNNVWYSRLGYYLGEALLRAFDQLRWSVGDSETVFHNHPVVIGFANGIEAAVITICRNMVLAVAVDGAPETRIDNGVNHWFAAGAE